jgi:hypothetical protein
MNKLNDKKILFLYLQVSPIRYGFRNFFSICHWSVKHMNKLEDACGLKTMKKKTFQGVF